MSASSPHPRTSAAPPQTLMIDLRDGCLTQNYWQEVLQPYLAQSLPSFLADRWYSPEFRKTFSTIAENLFTHQDKPMHPPDLITYSEKLVSCIQNDLWPKGVATLLSQIVSLGVGTSYLQAQLHADTINSFKRWQSLGWRIITLSELSSLAQRHLLQNTQAGDLTEYVRHTIPLSAKLPKIEHCTIVSARTNVLDQGKAAGYNALQLNRHDTQAPSNKSFLSHANTQIIEMDLIDLFLNK